MYLTTSLSVYLKENSISVKARYIKYLKQMKVHISKSEHKYTQDSIMSLHVKIVLSILHKDCYNNL